MTETDHTKRQAHVGKAASIAALIFLALCTEVLFSIFYRTLHLATHSAPKAWLAGCVGLGACALAFRARHTLGSFALSAAKKLPGFVSVPISSLLVGLLLRLAWIARFHGPFTSDGDGYFQEAINLSVRHTYGGPYWPPGFPLFLTPFFAALGAKQWVAWFCALLLFSLTWLMVRQLAVRMTGTARAGVIAGWLLAVWPGYIAVSSINSKEVLLACILSAMMLLAYDSQGETGAREWTRMLGLGILTGCAALTQPGFTLFPAVVFASDWLRGSSFLRSVAHTAVIACAMLATVLPWTAYNYSQHHRYILISSNGGSVFYTANNAKANASYSEESQQALPADPIEADRVGYALGKQWIREHPLDFAMLGIRKQVVFLGDDGIGVYESLKRGKSPSGLTYNGLKAICSAFWLFLWLSLLCCRRSLFHAGPWTGWFGVALLSFLYQWAIDSVFESGSRHHMAYVGCLALLFAIAVTRAIEDGAAELSTRLHHRPDPV